MAKEIERKFLVTSDLYKEMALCRYDILQAYIARMDRGIVRVRIQNENAFLTLKTRNTGMSRDEWEYEIPKSQAEEIIEKLSEGGTVHKTRYIVDYGGLEWEVDEFHEDLQGLCVAEVEVPSEGTVLELPPFIGREVTGERRFYNSVLLELNSSKKNKE